MDPVNRVKLSSETFKPTITRSQTSTGGLSISIETNNLRLESLVDTKKVFENHLRLFQNEEAMKTFGEGKIYTKEGVRALFDKWIQLSELQFPFLAFSIYKKSTNEFVGMGTLKAEADGTAEILGVGLPKFWGRKYGTESALALMHYARTLIGTRIEGKSFNKVFATTLLDNIPTQSILEKFGMNYEGIVHKYGADRHLYTLEIKPLSRL